MGVRSWQQWRAIVTRSNISSICSIPELEILYQLRSSAIMLVSCDCVLACINTPERKCVGRKKFLVMAPPLLIRSDLNTMKKH